MKAKTNFYLFLFLELLVSCSKAQEKTPQLSTHDKNLINKKIDNKNFKIDYVKKTDSIQNVKTALHFDENLNLYEKQVEKYGDNKKLLLSSIYKPEKENKNILVLHSEKKYTYADGLTKENTIVWKNNKEFGYTFVEKYFNKKNEPLKNTLKAYKKGSKDTLITRENYTYTFNKTSNTETVCSEEYENKRQPTTFKHCTEYLYIDGKKTVKNGKYPKVYDDKNRIIKEISIDENQKPYFEDLYNYDDAKNTMEHQRYRFDHSRFLAVKELNYYNKKGSIEKIIYFGLNEEDKFLPKEELFIFYDVNNKEYMRVKVNSKTFAEKTPTPP